MHSLKVYPPKLLLNFNSDLQWENLTDTVLSKGAWLTLKVLGSFFFLQ
jgi:hypothetical protein